MQSPLPSLRWNVPHHLLDHAKAVFQAVKRDRYGLRCPLRAAVVEDLSVGDDLRTLWDAAPD